LRGPKSSDIYWACNPVFVSPEFFGCRHSCAGSKASATPMLEEGKGFLACPKPRGQSAAQAQPRPGENKVQGEYNPGRTVGTSQKMALIVEGGGEKFVPTKSRGRELVKRVFAKRKSSQGGACPKKGERRPKEQIRTKRGYDRPHSQTSAKEVERSNAQTEKVKKTGTGAQTRGASEGGCSNTTS